MRSVRVGCTVCGEVGESGEVSEVGKVGDRSEVNWASDVVVKLVR